jgi:hypothetical protein
VPCWNSERTQHPPWAIEAEEEQRNGAERARLTRVHRRPPTVVYYQWCKILRASMRGKWPQAPGSDWGRVHGHFAVVPKKSSAILA